MEDLVYKIELKANDEIGPSTLQGLLILKENGFCMKLLKTCKALSKLENTNIILRKEDHRHLLSLNPNYIC
jgi:hypothetical protein